MLCPDGIHISRCGRFILDPGPAQQSVIDQARKQIRNGGLILIEGGPGSGKTNVLGWLWRFPMDRMVRLSIREMLAYAGPPTSDAYLELVEVAVRDALSTREGVAIDDLFRFYGTLGGGPGQSSALLEMLLRILADFDGRRTIIATAGDGELLHIHRKSGAVGVSRLRIPDPEPSDYRRAFVTAFGEAGISAVDFELVHRLAKPLSGFELNMICAYLHVEGVKAPTTPEVIEVLGKNLLRPNAKISEVNAILATHPGGLACVIGAG